MTPLILVSLAVAAMPVTAALQCPDERQIADALARLRAPGLPPRSELSWSCEDSPEGAHLVVRSARADLPSHVVERRLPFDGDSRAAADAVAIVSIQQRQSILPDLPALGVETDLSTVAVQAVRTSVQQPADLSPSASLTRILVTANGGLAAERVLSPLVGVQVATELAGRYVFQLATALPLSASSEALAGARMARERVWSSSFAALVVVDGRWLRFATGPALVFSLDHGEGQGEPDIASGSRGRWAVGPRLEIAHQPRGGKWAFGIQATAAATFWSADFLGASQRTVLDPPPWVLTCSLQVTRAVVP